MTERDCLIFNRYRVLLKKYTVPVGKIRILSQFPGNTSEKQKEGIAVGKKKEKPIDLKGLAPEENVKYEIAEELGLLDKVLEHGWKSLTSKETGRIGGLVTKKKRNLRND